MDIGIHQHLPLSTSTMCKVCLKDEPLTVPGMMLPGAQCSVDETADLVDYVEANAGNVRSLDDNGNWSRTILELLRDKTFYCMVKQFAMESSLFNPLHCNTWWFIRELDASSKDADGTDQHKHKSRFSWRSQEIRSLVSNSHLSSVSELDERRVLTMALMLTRNEVCDRPDFVGFRLLERARDILKGGTLPHTAVALEERAIRIIDTAFALELFLDYNKPQFLTEESASHLLAIAIAMAKKPFSRDNAFLTEYFDKSRLFLRAGAKNVKVETLKATPFVGVIAHLKSLIGSEEVKRRFVERTNKSTRDRKTDKQFGICCGANVNACNYQLMVTSMGNCVSGVSVDLDTEIASVSGTRVQIPPFMRAVSKFSKWERLLLSVWQGDKRNPERLNQLCPIIGMLTSLMVDKYAERSRYDIMKACDIFDVYRGIVKNVVLPLFSMNGGNTHTIEFCREVQIKKGKKPQLHDRWKRNKEETMYNKIKTCMRHHFKPPTKSPSCQPRVSSTSTNIPSFSAPTNKSSMQPPLEAPSSSCSIAGVVNKRKNESHEEGKKKLRENAEATSCRPLAQSPSIRRILPPRKARKGAGGRKKKEQNRKKRNGKRAKPALQALRREKTHAWSECDQEEFDIRVIQRLAQMVWNSSMRVDVADLKQLLYNLGERARKKVTDLVRRREELQRVQSMTPDELHANERFVGSLEGFLENDLEVSVKFSREMEDRLMSMNKLFHSLNLAQPYTMRTKIEPIPGTTKSHHDNQEQGG